MHNILLSIALWVFLLFFFAIFSTSDFATSIWRHGSWLGLFLGTAPVKSHCASKIVNNSTRVKHIWRDQAVKYFRRTAIENCVDKSRAWDASSGFWFRTSTWPLVRISPKLFSDSHWIMLSCIANCASRTALLHVPQNHPPMTQRMWSTMQNDLRIV